MLRTSAGVGKDTVYKLRFSYPEDLADAKLMSKAKALAANPNLTALLAHPEAINEAYGYKGDNTNKPTHVVDDGTKTYFEFSGDTPAIFLVKKDRSETLVNYRREGDVIVVDKVAAQWTLRNGSQATCVFNLHAVADPAPATAMTPIVASDDPASGVDVAAQPPTEASMVDVDFEREAALSAETVTRAGARGSSTRTGAFARRARRRGDGLRLVSSNPSLRSARQYTKNPSTPRGCRNSWISTRSRRPNPTTGLRLRLPFPRRCPPRHRSQPRRLLCAAR